MNLRAATAAALLAFSLLGPARAWDLQAEVTARFVEQDGSLQMLAINRLPVPVTATFTLSLDNLRSSAGERFTVVLEPDSSCPVSRLRIVDPDAAYSYRWEWHWLYGRAGAAPASAGPFRLPYRGGEQYPVTEAAGTCDGHQGAMFHSVDWGMPEGTPIVAAREGIVVDVESRYSQAGGEEARDRANYVILGHRDGSLADYVHLRRGGVTVKQGERVRAGQVIGYSGNTGWSTGPHLHFRVLRPVDGFRYESLPVRFLTVEDGNAALEKGDAPTACAAAAHSK